MKRSQPRGTSRRSQLLLRFVFQSACIGSVLLGTQPDEPEMKSRNVTKQRARGINKNKILETKETPAHDKTVKMSLLSPQFMSTFDFIFSPSSR